MIRCKPSVFAVIQPANLLVVPATVPHLVALIKRLKVQGVDGAGVKRSLVNYPGKGGLNGLVGIDDQHPIVPG